MGPWQLKIGMHQISKEKMLEDIDGQVKEASPVVASNLGSRELTKIQGIGLLCGNTSNATIAKRKSRRGKHPR